MSVTNVVTTYSCDWVLEQTPESMAAPTYCPKTISTERTDPPKILPPETERDFFQWAFVSNGDRPQRHFCPDHAPLVRQMGLAR